MPQQTKLDRAALHQYLWRKANDRGRLEIKINDLAEALQVERGHMGRIIREMVDDGRLRLVNRGVSNVGTYSVVSPVGFDAAKPKQRRIKWE